MPSDSGLEMIVQKQEAPWPVELDELVASCTYRPGWQVRLDHEDRGQGSVGLTLTITTNTINSYEPHERLFVRHLFPVPPAAYNRASWMRWLFECFHSVELHECMEFFTIGGEKPLAPNHGPGWDPYLVTQLSTDLDRRTSFRGEVNS